MLNRDRTAWPYNFLLAIFKDNHYIGKILFQPGKVYDSIRVCQVITTELQKFPEEETYVVFEHYHAGRTFRSISDETGMSYTKVLRTNRKILEALDKSEFFQKIDRCARATIPGCMDYPLVNLMIDLPFISEALTKYKFYTMADIDKNPDGFKQLVNDRQDINWCAMMNVLHRNGYAIMHLFPDNEVINWLVQMGHIKTTLKKEDLHYIMPMTPGAEIPRQLRGKRPKNPYRYSIEIDVDFDDYQLRDALNEYTQHDIKFVELACVAVATAIKRKEEGQ